MNGADDRETLETILRDYDDEMQNFGHEESWKQYNASNEKTVKV